MSVKIVDMKGCARCDEAPHEGVTFEELTYPIQDCDGTEWNYWAPCPTNGEPILMRFETTVQ